MGMGKITLQHKIDIVHDMKQQDGITDARLDHNKYSSPYGGEGG